VFVFYRALISAAADPEAAARKLEADVQSAVRRVHPTGRDGDGPAGIDWQLLGLGMNGHGAPFFGIADPLSHQCS
jgi:hypothetical protein